MSDEKSFLEQAIDQIQPRDEAHAKRIEAFRQTARETQARQAQLIEQFIGPSSEQAQAIAARKAGAEECQAEESAFKQQMQEQRTAQLEALERIVRTTRRGSCQ